MNALLICLLALGTASAVFAEDAAAPAAPAAPAAACAAPDAAEEPLLGCAEHLAKVTAGYEKALKEWKAFARAASNRLKIVIEKEQGAKKKIQENSAEINALKFKRSKADKGRIKDLERDNKALWKTLKGIESDKARVCKEISKEGAAKQDALSDSLRDLWKTARGSLR